MQWPCRRVQCVVWFIRAIASLGNHRTCDGLAERKIALTLCLSTRTLNEPWRSFEVFGLYLYIPRHDKFQPKWRWIWLTSYRVRTLNARRRVKTIDMAWSDIRVQRRIFFQTYFHHFHFITFLLTGRGTYFLVSYARAYTHTCTRVSTPRCTTQISLGFPLYHRNFIKIPVVPQKFH